MQISLWFMKNSHFNRALSLDFLYGYSRKVVGRKGHAAIPKGIMGYYQYTVSDNVAAEPTFSASL